MCAVISMTHDIQRRQVFQALSLTCMPWPLTVQPKSVRNAPRSVTLCCSPTSATLCHSIAITKDIAIETRLIHKLHKSRNNKWYTAVNRTVKDQNRRPIKRKTNCSHIKSGPQSPLVFREQWFSEDQSSQKKMVLSRQWFSEKWSSEDEDPQQTKGPKYKWSWNRKKTMAIRRLKRYYMDLWLRTPDALGQLVHWDLNHDTNENQTQRRLQSVFATANTDCKQWVLPAGRDTEALNEDKEDENRYNRNNEVWYKDTVHENTTKDSETTVEQSIIDDYQFLQHKRNNNRNS